MDCLTTVIGVLYFGAIESNPLIAGVASYSLPAFVVLKMTATLFSCLIFVQAEKILMQSKDKSSSSISRTQTFLRVARGAVVAFLFVVVANNVLVLASAF
jgi:membrane protein DedA with SNARE-associated domain